MAITTQEIHAVADQIVAAGGNPTLAAVRSALGGGSYTTISEAMQAWKARHQAVTAPIREPAPPVVTERLNEFAGELWTVAMGMANDRLAAEREALEQVRKDLEQARQEAVDLADQISVELEQAQAVIAQRTELAEAGAGEIARQAEEIQGLTRQLGEANGSAHTAQAALTEAHGHTTHLSALLDQERAARVDAESRAGAAEQQVAVLSAKLEDCQAARQQAEIRATEANQAAQAAQLAEQTVQVRLESVTRELEAATQATKEARAEAKKSMEEAAELRGKLAALAPATPAQTPKAKKTKEPS